jgi:uncharacterized Zn-binding protein involved in type VI secretion
VVSFILKESLSQPFKLPEHFNDLGRTTEHRHSRNRPYGQPVARVGDTTDHEGELENGDGSWLID